jgi:hypothetical protein
MAENYANRIWKPQISGFSVYYNNTLRVLDNPKSAELDFGFKELVRSSTSSQGVEVDVSREIQAEKPKFSVEMGGLTEEVWEIMSGRLWQESASVASFYGRNRDALNTVSWSADAAGFEGYGIAADAVGYAAIFKNGKSVALTQQTFGTFNPATLLSFGVGANGQMVFSTDTLEYQKSWKIPQTLSNVRTMSSTRVANVGVILTIIDASLYVYRFSAPNCQPILDGLNINFAAETQKVQFAVQFDGSSCRPLDFVSTGLKVTPC